MSLWPCQEWKTFLNITKVNIYAYSHINIKNILTFQRIFDILKLKKSYKIKKIWRFWIKQGPFTQNFAKQPNIFLFLKFLELFFTPKNTPPKVKKSKIGLNHIFLGTPCRYINFQTSIVQCKWFLKWTLSKQIFLVYNFSIWTFL